MGETNIDFDVEFEYECEKQVGFAMNPHEQRRCGFMTAVNIIGLDTNPGLVADLNVAIPYNFGWEPVFQGIQLKGDRTDKSGVSRAVVVGIIEKFTWRGGACDPVVIDFYISQQNCLLIKTLVQASLKKTLVSTLAWWIVDYDSETKQWFEQCFPVMNSVGWAIEGHITGRYRPMLEAHLTPTKVADNIDVNVYKAKVGIVPTGKDLYKMSFAASPNQPVVRPWGIILDQT